MDNILAVNNVIDVTISSIGAGVLTPNVNNVALFTQETPSNPDAYNIYRDPTEIGKAYGTDSMAYLMAVNIFSQTPNLLSGAGQLITIPLVNAVSATEGKTVTVDLSGNLAAFQAVSDGELTLTLNGVDTNITALDFTAAQSIADVISIIATALINVNITLASTGLATFLSKKVGATSEVILSTFGAGGGTDITAVTLLNIVAATATGGADSSGEAMETAIARAKAFVSFCGIITTLKIEDDLIDEYALAVQAGNYIAVHPFADTNDLDNIISDVQAASQSKFRCVLYTESLDSAYKMAAAYVGRGFSVNHAAANTVITMNLKKLTNVTFDGGITQTLYELCKTKGADVYVSYDGFSGVLSTAGNEYFDRVYNQQQLKFELQTDSFNYLATTQTKIPQTESGMNGFKAAQRKVLERFVKNGYIGIGLSWNSADTIGNPEDMKRNITDFGYYIYSLPIAQQSQTDRDARKAPVTQVAIKEAGSIHTAIINVFSEA